MKRTISLIAVGAAVLAGSMGGATAASPKPSKSITISASQPIVVFGGTVSLSGVVSSRQAGGHGSDLQRPPRRAERGRVEGHQPRPARIGSPKLLADDGKRAQPLADLCGSHDAAAARIESGDDAPGPAPSYGGSPDRSGARGDRPGSAADAEALARMPRAGVDRHDSRSSEGRRVDRLLDADASDPDHATLRRDAPGAHTAGVGAAPGYRARRSERDRGGWSKALHDLAENRDGLLLPGIRVQRRQVRRAAGREDEAEVVRVDAVRAIGTPIERAETSTEPRALARCLGAARAGDALDREMEIAAGAVLARARTENRGSGWRRSARVRWHAVADREP